MKRAGGREPVRSGCLLQVFLVSLSLALVWLLASAPLTAIAVGHRLLPPPTFAVRLGQLEVIAPCPRGVMCDESTPYFGIWLGSQEPDGSFKYRHLFFMYRQPARRR